MIQQTLTDFIDLLHAKLCYQLFITPIHLPIEKEYREFARKACDYFLKSRSNVYIIETPRHHVIHHFAQQNPKAKKILITHGWISRAAYMAKLIKALHEKGYEIYALDFPAHGEAKGRQLPWFDAVEIIKETINNFGPFYGVIGHSFGGAMLLNTINLAAQIPDQRLKYQPERIVLLASPTRMHSPVQKMAKKLKLRGKAYSYLRSLFQVNTLIDIRNLSLRHYVSHAKIPILCIHGENDSTVSPEESLALCKLCPNASLQLLPKANHVDVLIDEQVAKNICQFLA